VRRQHDDTGRPPNRNGNTLFARNPTGSRSGAVPTRRCSSCLQISP
jgi:hypothetical protein